MTIGLILASSGAARERSITSGRNQEGTITGTVAAESNAGPPSVNRCPKPKMEQMPLGGRVPVANPAPYMARLSRIKGMSSHTKRRQALPQVILRPRK